MEDFHNHILENVDQFTLNGRRDYSPSEIAILDRKAELAAGVQNLEELNQLVNKQKTEVNSELNLIGTARRALNRAKLGGEIQTDKLDGINKLLQGWRLAHKRNLRTRAS